jgi:hypothetical protein
MRSSTRFHADQQRRARCGEGQQLLPRKLLAQHDLTTWAQPNQVKGGLAQLDADVEISMVKPPAS